MKSQDSAAIPPDLGVGSAAPQENLNSAPTVVATPAAAPQPMDIDENSPASDLAPDTMATEPESPSASSATASPTAAHGSPASGPAPPTTATGSEDAGLEDTEPEDNGREYNTSDEADKGPSHRMSTIMEEREDMYDSIPDYSRIPNADLRKVQEPIVQEMERYGELYWDIFRELQISPDNYARFYSGVLRHIRNKHPDEIKGGTAAARKYLTDLVLRGFGYIVWPPSGSDWLIPADELDMGEERLVHVRLAGAENEQNARFYPLLEQIWTQMRNVLFEPKPTPRGRASREQQSATDSQAQGSSAQANAGPMIMASTNPTPTGTGPPATAPSATIAPATAGGPTDADLMTPAETEVALGSLIDAFNELRSKSLPGVFETLYEQFLMEQDELDLARAQEDARAANADPANPATNVPAQGAATNVPVQGATTNVPAQGAPTAGPAQAAAATNVPGQIAQADPAAQVAPTATPGLYAIGTQAAQGAAGGAIFQAHLAAYNYGTDPNSAQSNEPWMSKGNPQAPTAPESERPDQFLPAFMSVYISTQHLGTPALLPQDWTAVYNANRAMNPVSQHALLWHDAPVLNTEADRDAFFHGINSRIPDHPSMILGYVLSYGWSDQVRFVSTGRLENRDLPAPDAAGGAQGQVDFHTDQAGFVNLGWIQFHHDLVHAALNGVRIFRMKVGVLALASSP